MSGRRESGSAQTFADVRNPQLLKRGLLIYGLLVLISGWSYGLWQINDDRERSLAASSNQLMMTATILAGHLEAMINDGVGAATAGASEVRALDKVSRLSTTQMSDVLARMLTGGEYVHTLFIATPAMFVTAQRDSSIPLPDRPAWAAQLLATTGDTWVGVPVNTEQGDMSVLIPIARRTTSIRGEPTWAGALFSVYSLDRMYRSLPIEHSTVGLIRLDGIGLIRLPTRVDVKIAGMDMTRFEVVRRFQQLTPPPATLEGIDPFSGKPRQFAVRRLDQYAVLATSGRNVDDALLAWQQRRTGAMWTLAIGSMTLMLLAGMLYVLLQRRFMAITRSEQRFELAVAGTNDGIWEWDIRTNQMYYSPRFRQLLGVAENDEFPAVPATFWELIHPDDKRPTELALQRHLLHRDLNDVEYRLRTRDGQYRWFRARGRAEWDEQGQAVRMAGSISDIHDKKLAEDSLEQARHAELRVREELTHNLLLAQEQERQRLANELHDSVGQNLSLIKNHALILLQQAELPPFAMRHVASLEALATDVISEVRAVAYNLRPLHIEELGLTDAIRTLIEKMRQSDNLLIEAHLEDVQGVIQGVAATHLYRIAQEALNNVLKHAGATRCRVTLERDINCVRLIVADDGAGFDSSVRGVQGIGLSSIAERARILHAVLRVQSVVGRGTTVHVELPLAETEAQDAD